MLLAAKKLCSHIQTTGYKNRYVYEIWIILARRSDPGTPNKAKTNQTILKFTSWDPLRSIGVPSDL